MTARPVLDPGGTAAPMIGVRLTEQDVTRILRLAKHRRVRKSALLREALRYALTRMEADDAAEAGSE